MEHDELFSCISHYCSPQRAPPTSPQAQGGSFADLDLSDLVAKIKEGLPRLVFANFDHFPLAGGEKTQAKSGIRILAVRAVPVDQRLSVLHKLECAVSGEVHQPRARTAEIHLDGGLSVSVHWHDAADFAALLLKGSPSCVEALSCRDEPLYASREWAALRDVFDGSACKAAFRGKAYRSACAGPIFSLLGVKSRGSAAGGGSGGAAKREGAPVADETRGAVIALAQRACAEDVGEGLRTQVEELSRRSDVRAPELADVASGLMQAALRAPDTARTLPRVAVDAWCDRIRSEAFQDFAARCAREPHEALATAELPPDWSGRLRQSWPAGAGLVFMVRSGSFLYGLHTAASDSDFALVYLSPGEAAAGRAPPATQFQCHSDARFGSDKAGVVEYSGKELGSFLAELAKGSPIAVELLFTDRLERASPLWRELRGRRRGFLTLRCAAQYLGFIKDRLAKAASEAGAFAKTGDEAARRSFSKCMYQAHHKVFELRRVLSGGEPAVALDGEERDFVMDLRLRPLSSAESMAALERVNADYSGLIEQLDAARAAGKLPAEVDVPGLARWMQAVRSRQAAGAATPVTTGGGAPPVQAPSLARKASTRSSSHGDAEAISAVLEDIERARGIRIVHAGYAPSSRTLGTMHGGSDHDVHVIFVLRRVEYFGMHEPLQKFCHSCPPAGDTARIDVSGWEARHACRLLAEGNPSVVHVLHSPLEFRTTRWTQPLRAAVAETLDARLLALAWWKHGRQNYLEYIKRREAPVRKKYVHVLRPLLSLEWLLFRRQGGGAALPPAGLLDLARQVHGDGQISSSELAAVERLASATGELPLTLPKDRPLDELIQRLLGSSERQLEDWGAPTNKRVAVDASAAQACSARWNQLCASMVEDMAEPV